MDGRDKTRLSTTHKLTGSLKECFLQLEELNSQLKPGKTRKAMSRFGVRSLQWPFMSEKVENLVASLESYEQTYNLALQIKCESLSSRVLLWTRVADNLCRGIMLDVDQKMNLIDKKTDNLHQKIDFAKLPVANGASFDSHIEEHNARCLANTRVELQRQIKEWAKDGYGKPIFWLNGMAGIGKSTIARTVARLFADEGQLGASFFFKKSEGDRGTAGRFFTTIAKDLMTHVPGLISGIAKAIDADPAISDKALKEQFEKLILQPLSELKQAPPNVLGLVIVIDALDECERDEDIKAILQLLARTKCLEPISLRAFVTSRPELPIRVSGPNSSRHTKEDN